MKRGSKKPEGEETDSKKPESEGPGIDNPRTEKTIPDSDGIDGIRALQILAGGMAILALAWYVLHNILRII